MFLEHLYMYSEHSDARVYKSMTNNTCKVSCFSGQGLSYEYNVNV